jgi:hypothetical protein
MQQLITTRSLDTSVLEDAIRPVVLEGEVMDVEVGSDGPDEETMMQDLYDVVVLVKRSKTLFDYLADPELCKAISKKERTSMMKLSAKLGEYLSGIDSTYGEISDADIPF